MKEGEALGSVLRLTREGFKASGLVLLESSCWIAEKSRHKPFNQESYREALDRIVAIQLADMASWSGRRYWELGLPAPSDAKAVREFIHQLFEDVAHHPCGLARIEEISKLEDCCPNPSN